MVCERAWEAGVLDSLVWDILPGFGVLFKFLYISKSLSLYLKMNPPELTLRKM